MILSPSFQVKGSHLEFLSYKKGNNVNVKMTIRNEPIYPPLGIVGVTGVMEMEMEGSLPNE
jgi:hypothetical protein